MRRQLLSLALLLLLQRWLHDRLPPLVLLQRRLRNGLHPQLLGNGSG